ncbi:MAG TPA: hypothetical protein VFB28_04145 [Terriglobales bacterium]|nr:hypothetical protein [Terriglobales bacterium]
MRQRDAARVDARIDNLPRWDGTMRVDPVTPPPTVSRGRVGDVHAVSH